MDNGKRPQSHGKKVGQGSVSVNKTEKVNTGGRPVGFGGRTSATGNSQPSGNGNARRSTQRAAGGGSLLLVVLAVVAFFLLRGTGSGNVDIGTGTGCIAVTLARQLPGFRTEGWDISPDALDIAAGNAAALQAHVTFRQADILSWEPAPDECGAYDIWVSNPPYVRESEKKEMRPNVLDYEPHTALFVPDDDPLLFYRKIAQTALRTLRPGGALYFEINAALGGETQKLITDIGYRQVELLRDMQQRDRIIAARHP